MIVLFLECSCNPQLYPLKKHLAKGHYMVCFSSQKTIETVCLFLSFLDIILLLENNAHSGLISVNLFAFIITAPDFSDDISETGVPRM